jgi:uncharacterized protein YecT (DUF1311 family)
MTMRRTFALLLFACSVSPALADPMDDWCKTVKLPSSIAICSDPELRALTTERAQAFNEARWGLDPRQDKALLADQTAWVKLYPLKCGLAKDTTPALPLAPAIKDCMAEAGRARIAYLRAYALTRPRAPSSSSRPLPKVAHVTISRWWCPFYGAFYPQVGICPNWESIQREVDCTTATEADVVARCREEAVRRAEASPVPPSPQPPAPEPAAPGDQRPQQTPAGVPIEKRAVLIDYEKGTLQIIDAAIDLARGNGYSCASVSGFTPMLFTRGFKLVCNNYSYTYDVEDHGAGWEFKPE